MNNDNVQNMYRHDLGCFIRFAFNELHPHVTYQHNWHIDALAHKLKQVMDGDVQKLIINLPPRMLKSHCVSIAWPSWILGRDPRKSILCLHGHNNLGRDLHDSTWELMQSRRYRALFKHMALTEDGPRIKTNHGGSRQHLPLMGRLTGLGADIIIIDDPMTSEDVRCDTTRQQINLQFDENVLQRLTNKKTGAIIVVMQRLHEDDLCGHLLAKDDGWEEFSLPAVALQDETWELPYGRTYHRKKGEALHPQRESIETLIETMCSIGGYSFAYQFLQGQYKLHFGEYGNGCIWLTPYREGIFWDARKESTHPLGFYHFSEKDLILPRVFNMGEDPCPDNMRHDLTHEEWMIGAKLLKEQQERDFPELRNQYER